MSFSRVAFAPRGQVPRGMPFRSHGGVARSIRCKAPDCFCDVQSGYSACFMHRCKSPYASYDCLTVRGQVRVCSKCMCHVDACTRTRVVRQAYCLVHSCPRCYRRIESGQGQCVECTCRVLHCVAAKTHNSMCCMQHTCPKCNREKATSEARCVNCQKTCHADHCFRAPVKSGFCEGHVCSVECCSGRVSLYRPSSYCDLHICCRRDCGRYTEKYMTFCARCAMGCRNRLCSSPEVRPPGHVGDYLCGKCGCVECHTRPKCVHKGASSDFCDLHVRCSIAGCKKPRAGNAHVCRKRHGWLEKTFAPFSVLVEDLETAGRLWRARKAGQKPRGTSVTATTLRCVMSLNDDLFGELVTAMAYTLVPA